MLLARLAVLLFWRVAVELVFKEVVDAAATAAIPALDECAWAPFNDFACVRLAPVVALVVVAAF